MGVHPYMGGPTGRRGPRTTAPSGRCATSPPCTPCSSRPAATPRRSWFTEFGWSALPTLANAPNWLRGVSLTVQAAYVQQTVRLVRSTMPWVTRIYW